MTKVTKKSMEAFIKGYTGTFNNTTVLHDKVLLHGNCIIKRDNGYIYINNCGRCTNVTKERLNGVIDILGIPYIHKIYQKQWAWYWKGGKEFKGNTWLKLCKDTI